MFESYFEYKNDQFILSTFFYPFSVQFGYINNDFSNEELQNKNLFIEVEKKKYPIEIINKPLKQTNFKNN